MTDQAKFKVSIKGPPSLVAQVAAKQTISPKATKAYVRKKI